MTDATDEPNLDQPWTQTWQDVAEQLDVDPAQGLSESEADRRRAKYGANRLRSTERKSTWQIFVEQFKSLIVGLLAVAAVLSFAFGELIEGVAIAVVILINAVIGFVTELRAVRSMEALQELSRVDAKVRRDGKVEKISAEEIVPGDVVVVDGGDVITADLRLLEASKLQVNESALTGESVPVGKRTAPLDEEVPLAERESMAFKGTAVTRGAGEGIVVATGMDTELGHISSLVEEAEEEVTPLEQRLEELGHRLIWVTLSIAAVVVAAGIIAGKDILLMVETGVALAVASIPEGLPIVATVALARGMWRMARRNALINKLSAVETLGATNVILTDKTGTLTENQMTAVELALPWGTITISGRGLATEGGFSRDGNQVDPSNRDILREALEVGVLCNNAAVQQEDGETQSVGDPSEVALLVAGAKAGMHQSELLDQKPEEREVAFDPEVNMMATYHRVDGRFHVAVKGAPNAVLEVASHIRTEDGMEELSGSDREQWLERNKEMAAEGLRVLALAEKQVDDVDTEPYQDLTFLGLIGLLDPPREDVRDALTACQEAGIRVVMITGDQPVTARKVGLAVGLIEEEAEVIHGRDLADIDTLSEEERQRVLRAQIFARVSPEQKLDLIALHQDQGAVVAMTGDGVNDAPALKKADIGVAMGQRGTQVAKEAADMVLKDDAFSTIVAAVEQGRAIFNNIRRFVLYLLSCNVAEVFTVGIASLANMPLPIRPLQILFLNLVTDVFPALALGMGEGDPTIMDRPPRDPEEPIMTKPHWGAVGGYGMVITLSVLGSLLVAIEWLDMAQDRAVTVSFLTLASAQLWHVFNMRDRDAHILNNDVTRNPFIWGALALSALLLLAAVYLPGLSDILGVVNPGLRGWALIGAASLVPLIIGQIALTLRHWQEQA